LLGHYDRQIKSMSAFDTCNLGLWLEEGADNAMARRVFDAISNGVTISDATLPGAPLIYVNPALERRTGYCGEEVIGLSCKFLQGTDRDQPGVHLIRAAIHEAREERALLRSYRKDRMLCWNELHLSPMFNAAGKLTHFVGIQNDVTAETNAKLQLSESANACMPLLSAAWIACTSAKRCGTKAARSSTSPSTISTET
jgi:PAS domain S-box-containing protein